MELKSWEAWGNCRTIVLGSGRPSLSFPVSLLTSQGLKSLVCRMGMKVLYSEYPSHFWKTYHPTQRPMIKPSLQSSIILRHMCHARHRAMFWDHGDQRSQSLPQGMHGQRRVRHANIQTQGLGQL